MIEVDVKGLRETINILSKFDKELTKELRQDLAKVSAPLVTAIRSNIPTYPPIRGFKHSGRTAWPTGPVKITTKLNTSKSRRGLEKTLVKISVINGGVEIADMAGKRNNIKTSGQTRSYHKGSVIMSHKLSGQGKYMIEALSQTGRGRASRYIYPVVEKFKDTITMEVEKTIFKFITKGNERLKKKVA